MQQTHDERSVPLNPEPESRSVLESIRFWLTFGQARRSKREAAQAKDAAENRPFREQQAATRAAMTGEQIAAAGAKALGKIGGGAL